MKNLRTFKSFAVAAIVFGTLSFTTLSCGNKTAEEKAAEEAAEHPTEESAEHPTEEAEHPTADTTSSN